MNLTTFKSIFFTCCISLIGLPSTYSQLFEDDNPSGKTLALVIGISDYQHISNLKYADKDAEDFANFLTAPKTGLGLPKQNVKLFTNKDATSSAILYQGLRWLEEELSPGDQAYIFFSGHGKVTNLEAKKAFLKNGYLLTHESQVEKYETSALKMENFLQEFHLIATNKEATVRVIMDICHAGVGMKSGGVLSEIQKVGELENQVVVASCLLDQKSYEYEALKNGVFTYFLIQGLKGAADINKNKKITLKELNSYTTENVERYVEANNHTEQSPDFVGEKNHLLRMVTEEHESPVIRQLNNSEFTSKGFAKGVDENAQLKTPELTQILKDLETGSASNREIQEAYDLYQSFPEKTAAQRADKRNMKRNLVALMTGKADKALTAYFIEEGGITTSNYYSNVSDYYLKSAKLLGKDHFQYNEMLSKYFFIEALRLKSQSPHASKVMDKLTTSLTLNPNASYTLNEIGNIYFDKGHYKKALTYYQKATDISVTWGKNVIKTNKKLGLNGKSNTPSSYGRTNTKSFKLESKDLVYQIQIAAAGAVNADQFKKIEDLGLVNPVYDEQKNIINSRMGPFESKQEAQSTLRKVQQRGFKDAYLVEVPKDDSFQKKLIEKGAELKKELAANSPYQIRLAAVKNFNPTDFASLKTVGAVEALPAVVNGKNIYRVLLPATTKQEANTLLQKVKKAGFKDAYIFKNKSAATKANVDRQTPNSYEANVSSGTYRIQIATISKLTKNQFLNLEQLGQVYIDVIPNKGLIRVFLGDFSSKGQTNEVLKKVKAQGYKDAYMQKYK